jgi:hypothetical protein
MIRKILSLGGGRPNAENENYPEGAERLSNVRALATEAALAVSVDTSPAVLVSLYDYAHRYRDRARRTA